MMRAWAPTRALAAALVAANAAVLFLALWPFLPDRASPARVPAPAARGDDRPALARLAPFAAYAATVERPLFSPSRRPPAGAAVAGPGSGIASRYRLQGLVIAGAARRALIVQSAGNRRFEVGEGDAIEGWVVRRIEQNTVVLASPAGEATLTLRRDAAAK
jgi:hypothetical protein